MTFKRFLSGLVILMAVLLLAGCNSGRQIGPRPAPDVLGSVEIYLQRYQPGPLPRVFQTTRIYDRHGVLLAERWEEGRRTWLPLEAISPHLIDATVATEDATFFDNSGFDPGRIAGAAFRNVQERQIVSGASTITMQLARNLFLGPEERYDQRMDRKLLELGLAQELTSLFSKDELLEMYLNLLNYGHLAYGPEAAATVYFGKSAAELSLAEATLLSGIPQRPAELDPFIDFEAARQRQRIVLDLMVRHGYLSPAEADAVFATPINLNPTPDAITNEAPHFVGFVEEKLDEELEPGLPRRSGLNVITTLDLAMQKKAQSLITKKIAGLKSRYDLSNTALVAMRPGYNEIVVMVGSADFDDETIDGQVNVAIRPRQPGSAIKPILYAAAIDENLISPATVLWDTPITYTVSAEQVYEPVNYDAEFHGPVTVRTALANSYNVPAVKLLDAVSVEKMVERAREMGLASLERDSDWYGLSLTLGGGEVTLLDLTTAFATLANEGRYVEPIVLLEVRDATGRPVLDLAPPRPVAVLSPASAFLVTDILSDNRARSTEFGENSPLKLDVPAAAKTGTTNDWRDNWTVGFTPYLVAGVWAGNSDGHPMKNTSGLTGAAPIWHDFMSAVLKDPALLETLQAPDPTTWQFSPPLDVQRLPDCPPGLTCPEEGEFFSQTWLEAAGEAGPLADSVITAPTAPVYVDAGAGLQWAGYCELDAAVYRDLLRLPGSLGLPSIPETPEVGEQRSEEGPGEPPGNDYLHALGWSLQHPLPVNLGRCDALQADAEQALMLADIDPIAPMQIFVDLAAANDPNAGPIPGSNPLPIASLAPGDIQFSLRQPVIHHNACPGNYVVGQVLDRDGAPLAGVHITMVDQWGNRADAFSKSGAFDYGRYDFLLNHFANRYTLQVVNEAGFPISPPVFIDHLQGTGGDAPCHTVDWGGGGVREGERVGG